MTKENLYIMTLMPIFLKLIIPKKILRLGLS